MNFAQRHIGPSAAEQEQMLAAIGYDSLDELTSARCRPASRRTASWTCPRRWPRTSALAELRRLAARNHPVTSMIGLGYYGTITPAGDPQERAGEPGLVHGVHAVPAGDLAGQARGAAELPDHGRGPDRAAGGRGVDAGRGDRRRGGDDAQQAGAGQGADLPGRRRLPAADAGGAGDQDGAARHRARHRAGQPGGHRRPAGRRAVRRAVALPGRQRGHPRPARRPSTPRTPAARW